MVLDRYHHHFPNVQPDSPFPQDKSITPKEFPDSMSLGSPKSHHSMTKSPRRLLSSHSTPKGPLNDHCHANVEHPKAPSQSLTSPRHSHHQHHPQHCSFTNYGLLITLDATSNQLCLQFCPDHNWRAIHPNSYAPRDFSHMGKMGGGGSGVAVFTGDHPELGQVVMKHGSDKDLTELVALATVQHELELRGKTLSSRAARHLAYRTPEFRMLYISPHHLSEQRRALWKRLRQVNRQNQSSMLLPIEEEDSSLDEDMDSSNNAHAQVRNDAASSNNSNSIGYSGWEQTEPEQQQSSFSNTASPKFSFPRTVTITEEKSESELEEMATSDSTNNKKENDKEGEAEEEEEDDEFEAESHFNDMKKFSLLTKANAEVLPPGVEISKSGTVTGHRDIVLLSVDAKQMAANHGGGTTPRIAVSLQGDSLLFELPEGHYDYDHDEHHEHQSKIRLHGDGYQALQQLYRDLLGLMQDNRWKFTMGQKRIGNHDSKTGNIWLYERQLKGKLLDNVITQNIKLVKDLVILTTPQEQDPYVITQIRQELQSMEQKGILDADSLSQLADAFVGNAIRKNFKSAKGRFVVLRRLGACFREHEAQQRQSFLRLPTGKNTCTMSIRTEASNLILTPEEKLPAHHLANLTRPGAVLGETFDQAPNEPTILETMDEYYWRTLLHVAVQSPLVTSTSGKKPSPMFLKRLWTCGLADAGLHNLFLSKDRIWLFDLGEPQLTSVPGFLTKFLFSFFHTLGMEEAPGSVGAACWVRRFEPNMKTKRLRLTTDTTKLLSEAYAAFELTLNRMVKELFDGDDSVRWLFIQYVTLQLFSDASFCLQKWTLKGGGRVRDMNHQEGIEKWLWRALWDIYVACDINSLKSMTRLKATHVSLDDQTASTSGSSLCSLNGSVRKTPSAKDLHMELIKELGFEASPRSTVDDNAFGGFLLPPGFRRSFLNASGLG